MYSIELNNLPQTMTGYGLYPRNTVSIQRWRSISLTSSLGTQSNPCPLRFRRRSDHAGTCHPRTTLFALTWENVSCYGRKGEAQTSQKEGYVGVHPRRLWIVRVTSFAWNVPDSIQKVCGWRAIIRQVWCKQGDWWFHLHVYVCWEWLFTSCAAFGDR